MDRHHLLNDGILIMTYSSVHGNGCSTKSLSTMLSNSENDYSGALYETARFNIREIEE